MYSHLWQVSAAEIADGDDFAALVSTLDIRYAPVDSALPEVASTMNLGLRLSRTLARPMRTSLSPIRWPREEVPMTSDSMQASPVRDPRGGWDIR